MTRVRASKSNSEWTASMPSTKKATLSVYSAAPTKGTPGANMLNPRPRALRAGTVSGASAGDASVTDAPASSGDAAGASPIDAKAAVAPGVRATAAQTTMVTTTPTTMRKLTAARTPVAAEPRRQPSISMNHQPPLMPFGLAVGDVNSFYPYRVLLLSDNYVKPSICSRQGCESRVKNVFRSLHRG